MTIIKQSANIGISTHILTKRMTRSIKNGSIVLGISTHILTKRMTLYIVKCINNHCYFNSHPHEEDDHATQTPVIRGQYFNSHPHEEDDESDVLSLLSVQHFNSHPHEEDDGTR